MPWLLWASTRSVVSGTKILVRDRLGNRGVVIPSSLTHGMYFSLFSHTHTYTHEHTHAGTSDGTDSLFPKDIDCIRVDGTSDEGPSHHEVQFWWTEWHMLDNKVATIVTRSSGSSYLNKVELMNGCIALGHSGTFIPCTLGCSCIDKSTGAVDQDKLKHNLELAIGAYTSRVNGCKCGDTVVNLYEGDKSTERQRKRDLLNIFLKGSRASKEALQREHPDVYDYFQQVWDLRCRHMVQGLPAQYVFFLRCCYDGDCMHLRCRSKPHTTPCWYVNGPPVTHLYLPVRDPSRPWGSTSCSTCKWHAPLPPVGGIGDKIGDLTFMPCQHPDTWGHIFTSNPPPISLIPP